MKGHALIHSGKWKGHNFFRKKCPKYPDPPLPIKNVPSLSGSFVHMKLRGFSARCFHGPSQRALVLDSLSFKPDKIPNSFSMSKAFWTDIRSLHMREVSSANWLVLSSL